MQVVGRIKKMLSKNILNRAFAFWRHIAKLSQVYLER